MIAEASITVILLLFAGAGGVICACGVVMTGYADRIADRTGMGEAIVGGVVLGAATSLSGTVVSVTAALDGRASLAFSNSIGGIAAQTAFLALADLIHRRANLEHAAAEVTNIIQGVILLGLLMLPFAALTTPEWTLAAIHPVSVLIPAVYVAGLFVSRTTREQPMWKPVRTRETRADTPDDEDETTARKSTPRLFTEFGLLMIAMAVAGWVIARTGSALTDRLELSASLVGALMTAVVTSLPELVTTLAAVRRGALQLAVGGIIGGNTFDTLFLSAADVAYRDGSLYHAAAMSDYFWVSVAALMTTVLLAGLIVREREGPAGIGKESLLILGIYGAAVGLQVVAW